MITDPSTNAYPSACVHTQCKCNPVESGQQFCSEFCEHVETSEDTQRCGCGHVMCDDVEELGNVSTFDATGS